MYVRESSQGEIKCKLYYKNNFCILLFIMYVATMYVECQLWICKMEIVGNPAQGSSAIFFETG